ncbi:hypothetical protein S83_018761 [Arachis hypogaea]
MPLATCPLRGLKFHSYPLNLPPQSASFVLPFRQGDSSPTKPTWWTPRKFNTIPMVFYFSVARQPCDHPTAVGATSVPVSLELKDTVVRAYRTDPVQVRSCPSVSLFDYMNARVLLRTSDEQMETLKASEIWAINHTLITRSWFIDHVFGSLKLKDKPYQYTILCSCGQLS